MEHIRLAYRNPVLQPEDNLTEEQAIVLFGVCVSFIVDGCRDKELVGQECGPPRLPRHRSNIRYRLTIK
jgi:hypothetical protein